MKNSICQPQSTQEAAENIEQKIQLERGGNEPCTGIPKSSAKWVKLFQEHRKDEAAQAPLLLLYPQLIDTACEDDTHASVEEIFQLMDINISRCNAKPVAHSRQMLQKVFTLAVCIQNKKHWERKAMIGCIFTRHIDVDIMPSVEFRHFSKEGFLWRCGRGTL